VAAEELPARNWFEIRPLLLGGRGVAPVAYELPWAGRTVLFSGRLPIRLRQPAVDELLKELAQSKRHRDHFEEALGRLGNVKPDLWLPALPVDGQNANLYGREWEQIIDGNRRLVFSQGQVSRPLTQ
jgi:hypothetical protein